jgi:hypothetical protein
MVQDISYFEQGYIDESYFAYIADAEVLDVGSFSMDTSASVIRGTSVEIAVSFVQTVVIRHLEGTDLFAFSDAKLLAEVDRIRDNNIQASLAFTIATDAKRSRNISASEEASFVIAISNSRKRDNEAAAQAAFSMTVTAIRAIRISASSQVQGQIIAQTGSILQTDLYPNYSQVTLSQPE